MKRLDKEISGIIYITTNLINGKWYIGKDECNKPKYLGSGIALNRAIEKYGRENFKKEILVESSTRNELAMLEKACIAITEATKNPMSYNIAEGGIGGHTIAGFTDAERKEFGQHTSDRWNALTDKEKKEFAENMSKQHKGKSKTQSHKDNLSKSAIALWTTEKREEKRQEVIAFYKTPEGEKVKQLLSDSCGRSGTENSFYGKTHTQETKDKVKETKKNNPQVYKYMFTPEQIEEIKILYLLGTPITTLCEIYKAKRHNIIRYLRSQFPNIILYETYNIRLPRAPYNIDNPKIIKKVEKITKKPKIIKEKIHNGISSSEYPVLLKLYTEGWSTIELAKKYNCKDKERISKILRKLLPGVTIYEKYNVPVQQRKIPKSEMDNLIALYKSGTTIDELCIKHRVSADTLRNNIKEVLGNIVLPNIYGSTRKSITDDKLSELKENYINGLHIKELAEKYNTHPKVLKRYLKKLFPEFNIISVLYINCK